MLPPAAPTASQCSPSVPAPLLAGCTSCSQFPVAVPTGSGMPRVCRRLEGGQGPKGSGKMGQKGTTHGAQDPRGNSWLLEEPWGTPAPALGADPEGHRGLGGSCNGWGLGVGRRYGGDRWWVGGQWDAVDVLLLLHVVLIFEAFPAPCTRSVGAGSRASPRHFRVLGGCDPARSNLLGGTVRSQSCSRRNRVVKGGGGGGG